MSQSMTDTDQISRIGWSVGAFAALAGIACLISAPWLIPGLLPAVGAAAFAYDPDFLPAGGAMVVTLWGLNAVVLAIVFFEGRWRPLTRSLDLLLGTMWFAALMWLAVGPRIYLSPATDEGAKGWISLVALFVLIGLGVKNYRSLRRP